MRSGRITATANVCEQEITGIWLEEEISSHTAGGTEFIDIAGKIFLLHADAPFLTSVAYQSHSVPYQYYFFAEQSAEISENLYHEILQSGTLSGSNSMIFNQQDRHVQKLHRHVIRQYGGRETVISAEITDYAMKTYGDLILKEISFQNEETMELLCYGILEQTIAKSAGEFLITLRRAEYATLAECYQGFVTWLNHENIAVTAAEQEFLNLENLPFSSLDSSVDVSGITAGMLLKEFAALEGGNARINHDNKLELGWCSTAPVLTISAENLQTMKIGTERLAAAEGVFSLNPDAQNYIRSARNPEDMLLLHVITPEAFAEACQRIVSSTAENFLLPFSVSALTGVSPFVRAGDCIRILTRNNYAVNVPVMMQEIRNFPFLQSRISMPETADWATIPVDFSRLHIFQISAGNYPDIIYGEIPDYSGMTITAYYFNGNFSVPPQLCEFTVEYSGNYAEITVYFAGCTASHLSGFTYALYTVGGRKLLTTDEKFSQ